MKHELEAYGLADPIFFDTPSRWYSHDGRFTVTRRPVPAGWQRAERDIWISMTPPDRPLPAQGWKVHVSAGLDNADRVLDKVYAYCVPAGVAFKFLATRNAHRATSFKYAPRAASGKLAAIYPADETVLAATLAELSGILAGEPGPYILSDLRYGDGPLYVRYGGFVSRYCTDEHGATQYAIERPDGVLVPDHRRPVFTVPDWVSLPAVLEPHRQARNAGAPDWPYQVDKALHFSNGGGVYLGRRREDQQPVVLKEGRPLAGLDATGRDAVARLHDEAAALRRLTGIPGVPELYDSFALWEHHFLAVQHMPGRNLQAWVAREYPGTRQDAGEQDWKRYTRRALAVGDRVARVLEAVHRKGMVFGDLHPANILVTDDDQVSLVDFEVSFDAAEERTAVIGYPGFVGRGRRGTDIDRYALAMLRLWLFLPLTTLLSLAPDKVDALLAELRERFDPRPGYVDAIRAVLATGPAPDAVVTGNPPVAFADAERDWTAVRDALAVGILATATGERTDRLFPGDPQQFVLDGFGFGYGAAGVLWALAVTGAARTPEHEQWLLSGVRRAQHLRAGFFDGAAGIAWVLAELGHHDPARALLDRAARALPAMTDVSVFSGLAGIGLTLLDFARRDPGAGHLDRARAAGEQLVAAVHSDAGHGVTVRRLAGGAAHSDAGSNAGLLRGWSGVAIFLLRLHETLAAAGAPDDRFRVAALRAVHRDLDLCVPVADGTLQVDGGFRTLPYLEIGSAGIALAAAAALPHGAGRRITESLPALAGACRPEFVIEPGLGNGRAGLLAVLAELGRGPAAGPLREAGLDPAADARRHLRLLDRHALQRAGGVAFPGEGLSRLSTDVLTGSAGVLLATSAACVGTPFLPLLTTSAGAALPAAAEVNR